MTKREQTASAEWLEHHARHRLGGEPCPRCGGTTVEDVLLREGGVVRRCTANDCGWAPSGAGHPTTKEA